MPRSALMPVGEHLLKVVEQLEIAASAADDTLAAFHAAAHEEPAPEGWWSLGGEMRRLGDERERAALGRAEVALREGVVRERRR